MADRERHVVTGAFGFSGKYIAQRLLAAGFDVRTLTNSPHRSNPFGGLVKAYPLSFDSPGKLVEALAGASVLYNTYWVRFNHPSFTLADAVAHTRALFAAAGQARVRKVVHLSITNPSEDSPFEYFRAKAVIERDLRESGLSYGILRPAVLFGREDILINNIAWVLRNFPVFGIFGSGSYCIQPIYVDDLAELAVSEGANTGNRIVDAIGPETFTFRELVREIGRAIGRERPVVGIPPAAGYFAARLIGKVFEDIMITHDEMKGLMTGLLCTTSPPVGMTKLTEWLRQHAAEAGTRYARELARRTNRTESYDRL